MLIDTNFINFSIKNKLDLVSAMTQCLYVVLPPRPARARRPTTARPPSRALTRPGRTRRYAKCTPCITDCVMAELEKLGSKYRVALQIAKDKRFERLACVGCKNYADDCLVERVKQHRCYIVATCDRDLKRRIRKVPGVPIMYIKEHKYSIERLPEAAIGGAPKT